MAAAHVGVLGVARVHGPHTGELVRDDRDAGARSARQHGEVGLPVGDQPRRAGRVHGVVHRFVRVGAAVDDLVPRALERGEDRLPQRVARVVESGGDSHGLLTIGNVAASARTEQAGSGR